MRRNCGPLVCLLIIGITSGVSGGEWGRIKTGNDESQFRLGKTAYVMGDVIPLVAPIPVKNGVGKTPARGVDLGKARAGADTFNLSLVAMKSETAVPESKPITPKTQKRRVLVFKASWCGACQGLNYEWPKLEAVRWKIGDSDTNHIQLVDADARPDLMAKYGVYSLPTLVLVEDDRELSRRGALNAFDIAEMFYGRL